MDLPLLANLQSEFFRDQRRIVLNENPRLKPYLQKSSDGKSSLVKQLRTWIRSGNAIVLIAEADSKPAGFATVSIQKNPPQWLPKRYGFIGYVFVRSRYRGQGISSMMMEQALAWFASRKIRHVALTVIEDNKPARAIWKKWGFYDFVVFAWKVNGPESVNKKP